MHKILRSSFLVLAFALLFLPAQGQTSAVFDHSEKSSANTASHVMLDHLYKGSANAQLSEKIYDVTAPKLAIKAKFSLKDAQLVESIIAQEKDHADKYVAYHALNSRVWYCLRVLSILRSMLDEKDETQTTMLRPLDLFFTRFPSAAMLMQGKQSDTDLSYQLAGLCCNPTLLSWLDRNDECTLEFFFLAISMAPPRDPWNIIELFFKEAFLMENIIIESIKCIYAEEFENKNVGCLLQIFLDPDILDEACYPSVDFGHCLKNLRGETIVSAKYALDSLRAGHLDSETPIEKVQIRLHADLARFKDKVRVIDHFTDGNHGRLAQLDKVIKDAFRPYIGNAVNGLLLKDYVFRSDIPSLLKKARHERGVQPKSLVCAHPNILCEFSGPIEFLSQVCENPSIMNDESELNQVCYFIGSSEVRPIKDIPLINFMLNHKGIFQNQCYLNLIKGFLNRNYDSKRYMFSSNILLLEGMCNFLVLGIKQGFIVDNMSSEAYSCVMKTLIAASHKGEVEIANTLAGIKTFQRAVADKPLHWGEDSENDFGEILYYLSLIGENSETILSEMVKSQMTIAQLNEILIQAYNKTDKRVLDVSALEELFN